MARPAILLSLALFIGCATPEPPPPPLVNGAKVVLSPKTLHVRGERIEMYGGNALLFKDPFNAALYLQLLKTGNLSEAGQMVIDGRLLPVNSALRATVIKAEANPGPSRIQVDLDALPPTHDKRRWKDWELCFVFNSQLKTVTENAKK